MIALHVSFNLQQRGAIPISDSISEGYRPLYRHYIGYVSDRVSAYIGTISALYRHYIGTISALYRYYIGTISESVSPYIGLTIALYRKVHRTIPESPLPPPGHQCPLKCFWHCPESACLPFFCTCTISGSIALYGKGIALYRLVYRTTSDRVSHYIG